MINRDLQYKKMQHSQDYAKYNIRVLEYLLSEKDEVLKRITQMVDNSFSEIDFALQELVTGTSQILDGVYQISEAATNLVQSVETQKKSTLLVSSNFSEMLKNGEKNHLELEELNNIITDLKKNSNGIAALINHIDDIARISSKNTE